MVSYFFLWVYIKKTQTNKQQNKAKQNKTNKTKEKTRKEKQTNKNPLYAYGYGSKKNKKHRLIHTLGNRLEITVPVGWVFNTINYLTTLRNHHH